MADGTRDELRLMELLTRQIGLDSYLLTAEEADEMERKGFQVARIPVVRRDQ